MSDSKQKVVIALGYFDCVHKGHKKVIEKACSLAKSTGAKSVVFTFRGNLRAKVFGKEAKNVYLLSERIELLKKLGVDEIFVAPVTKTFLNTGKLAFLNKLNAKYNVLAYVCGEDYRFGKNGKGTVEYLKKYAKSRNQQVEVVSDVLINGKKISTTYIKRLLAMGDIKGVNQELSFAYSITGKVIKDRGLGKRLGFPTANVKISPEKAPLKNGVYAGFVNVLGKEYKAIINYGSRPTFNLNETLLEAHLIDFNGNLYGKEITVYFTNFIRDVMKFANTEELVKRLSIDLEGVKNGKYN